MKRSLRDAWLKALRSGEHKQAQQCLLALDEDGSVIGRCCIGVLAEVAGLRRLESMREREVDGIYAVGSYEYPNSNLVDGLDTDWASLSQWDVVKEKIPHFPNLGPDAGYSALYEKLVDLNDSAGADFLQIADWVEAHVPVQEDNA